jgi:hypothetical protein
LSDQDATPVWRYLVPGALFAILAGHMLVTGTLPIDKRHTVIITRSSDPLIYWPVLLVSAVIAGLCIRKVWKRLTESNG